jgi:hypothetical protein
MALDLQQHHLDPNRRKVLSLLPTFALACLPMPAFAHRLTTTETRVDISGQTGKVDIVHTFHTHDTESTLFQFGIIDSADLTLLRPRAQMALYVEKNFSLTQEGQPVPLTLLGAEIEKRNVYTYQEGYVRLPLKSLSIEAKIMRPMVDNQINNVDVYIDGGVTSLQFRGADGRKNVLA